MFALRAATCVQQLGTDANGTFDNHGQIDDAVNRELIHTPLLIFKNDFIQVHLSYGRVLLGTSIGLSVCDVDLIIKHG